jgi:3',5'-cyclic AMP phosphodiesterase CpdA
MTWRVAQISDVHLIRHDADRLDRFHQIFQLALAHEPDCLVLSGDLTENGFDQPDDLSWAKGHLNALGRPVLLIPGNHDVGDKPGQGPNAITADRLAHWNRVFGADHFVHDLGPWRLIGLDSLLIASDLPEEHVQLAWLDRMLQQAARLNQQVAVFMHEPPFLGRPGKVFNDRSDYWAIAPDRQAMYLQRFTQPHVRLVASGHVHWYHAFDYQGVLHTWCPSPAFIVDDIHFPRTAQEPGLILYELTNQCVTHQLIRYDRPDTQVVQFQTA